MPRKINDLTGRRFGRLTVVGRGEDYVSPQRARKVRWLCRCDCGGTIQAVAQMLHEELTVGCGCVHRMSNANRKAIRG